MSSSTVKNGIFDGKVFFVVTGATRGIGKGIAKAFAPHLSNGSRVLLMSRNVENLRKTAHEMPKGLITTCKSIDFSKTTTYELQEALQESLTGEKPENFDRAIIVHCAAYADHSLTTNEMIDFNYWQEYFNLNIFSAAVLNGLFVNLFRDPGVKKYVINVCSYWGLRPDRFTGSYCASKAAKDMFFKVFAKENPNINVLNYLPGMVETDMHRNTLETHNDETVLARLKDAVDKNYLVTPAKTAEYLVYVVKSQQYGSGDYVDFMKSDVQSSHL